MTKNYVIEFFFFQVENFLGQKPELFWKTIKEYYCCSSIKNLTTLYYANGDGLTDEGKVKFHRNF